MAATIYAIKRVQQLEQRWRQLTLELGWLDGVLYLAKQAIERIFRGRLRIYKYRLFAQPVTALPLLSPNRGASIAVREICRPEELGDFPLRPQKVILDRYRQGAYSLIAHKGDTFVGCIWLVPGSYREDEVRCRFTPLPIGEAAWDFDVHVEPAHRGGVTFLRLWDEAYQLLRELGVHWSMSRISAFNVNSLGSHRRLGAKNRGSATFVCAGRWQVMVSTVAPYFHISLRESSFPEIRVRSD
jgi:hypothetical protein